MVSVEYKSQRLSLPIVVVKGERASLLGRNWLRHIKLDWKNIFAGENVHKVNVSTNINIDLQSLLTK